MTTVRFGMFSSLSTYDMSVRNGSSIVFVTKHLYLQYAHISNDSNVVNTFYACVNSISI